MTSYSSPSVHVCPGCDAFYLRRRLRSANFFGARDWSDGVPTMGWQEAPLVRCGACAALFWLDDVDAVGIMPDPLMPIGRLESIWLRWFGDPKGRLQEYKDWAGTMESWGRAHYVGKVSFDDVVYVLSRSKGVSSDRILWLRMRIWWDLNYRYRARADGSPYPDVPVWPVAAERNNMDAILDMLRGGETHPMNLIQQGELLRLLGRFDEAVAILKTVPPDGHSEIRALKIERLARSGDRQVRELSPPSW